MTADRRKFSWVPTAIQTFVLLGTIIGLAIANEHRITVLEETTATVSQSLRESLDVVKELQQTQVRLIVLVDEIEKRHQREDFKNR